MKLFEVASHFHSPPLSMGCFLILDNYQLEFCDQIKNQMEFTLVKTLIFHILITETLWWVIWQLNFHIDLSELRIIVLGISYNISLALEEDIMIYLLFFNRRW